MKKRNLTPREETRIRLALKHRILHFSPTISPAPKDESAGEIESIRKAIEYYREQGVKNVIIQPKYMGSYCDIYLHRDIEKSRFFSRKGFLISRILDHEKLVEAVRPIHAKLSDPSSGFSGWDGVEFRIVQAELMPWSALGDGLIERDFGGYETCHRSHLDYLTQSNLSNQIDSLKTDPGYRQYLDDLLSMSQKEVREKYPDHIIKQYEALSSLELPEVNSYRESIELYSKQLKIYGQNGPLHFKPFNWLKTVFANKRETVNHSNEIGFNFVSNEEYLSLTELGEDDIKRAYDYFNSLVSNNMEGVVIKPDKIWIPNVAPMFKVRNNNYLQMIYGVNFQKNYSYYLHRRKIANKVKCSISEWNIAQNLLRIPYFRLNDDPENKEVVEEYKKLVIARILEEDFEATLDGRL